MVESLLPPNCLIKCNKNIYGGVCITEQGLIATIFLEPKTPIKVRFHNQVEQHKAEIFLAFPKFNLSILRLPQCEDRFMVFDHVWVPHDINLSYGDELISFNPSLGDFACSSGRVAYPFPARTRLPEVHSTFNPVDIDTEVPAFGQIPCIRVKHTCVRQCAYICPDIHPELPLIQAHGVRGDKGCLGSPLFDKKSKAFLGIFLSGDSRTFSYYIPSTIISKAIKDISWGFRHPFLGMEVANLHEADSIFLARFRTRFPNISTAVIVTKVEEDSPASRSGMHTNDVIVKLDDKLTRSKLEFYETVCEKAGKFVVFNILREIDGEELNLSLVIEEACPNRFHQL